LSSASFFEPADWREPLGGRPETGPLAAFRARCFVRDIVVVWESHSGEQVRGLKEGRASAESKIMATELAKSEDIADVTIGAVNEVR
jgi:hypothetical protein